MHLQPQGAFVQFGQEFLSDGHPQADYGKQCGHADQEGNSRHGQHSLQGRTEFLLQTFERSVVENWSWFA